MSEQSERIKNILSRVMSDNEKVTAIHNVYAPTGIALNKRIMGLTAQLTERDTEVVLFKELICSYIGAHETSEQEIERLRERINRALEESDGTGEGADAMERILTAALGDK